MLAQIQIMWWIKDVFPTFFNVVWASTLFLLCCMIINLDYLSTSLLYFYNKNKTVLCRVVGRGIH